MKLITKESVLEYLLWANEVERRPQDFTMEQANAIGMAFAEANYMQEITPRILEGFEDGRDAMEILLSLAVACFQMGREFESRGIDAALKKTV